MSVNATRACAVGDCSFTRRAAEADPAHTTTVATPACTKYRSTRHQASHHLFEEDQNALMISAAPGRRSEELLQFHRGRHVALHLELPRHVGRRRVQVAADQLLEVFLRDGDRAV